MKKSKKLSLIFSSIIILIFLLAFLELPTLKEKISLFILTYNYPAIFFISLILDLLFQPIGPDLAIIAGIISGLNPLLILISATTGSVLASLISYSIGKRYGLPGFKKIARKRYEKYHNLFNKYGYYGLFISSISPVPYVPFCWFSGIFKLKIKYFILMGIIPRIIRFTVIALIALSFI